jgi:hypothetical protein
MKKLLLGAIFLIATVAESQTCVNPSGNAAAPNCTAAGELQIASRGKSKRVCVAIVPDTNIYAAGDIVGVGATGVGLLTFANAFTAAGSGLLQNIEVTNSEVDGIGYTFCPFTANPTASTTADQGLLAVAAADRQKWMGCVPVSVGVALAASEIYTASNLALAIETSGAAPTSLFGVLRTVGAPTWAAAQTVNVCVTILQD